MNITIKKHDRSRIIVHTPYSPAFVERFKAIPGYKYHPDTKGWSFPLVRDVVLMVCDVVGFLPWMLDTEITKEIGADGVQTVNRIALDMSVVENHAFLVTPFEHQKVNLARLIQNNRWLLCDDMGTGKSAAIVNRFICNEPMRDVANVLVVCPKSTMHGWVDHFYKHGLWIATIYETGKRRPLLSPLIVNYEALLARKDDFIAADWDMLVIDEVHRCKDHSSKTNRVLRKMSAKAKYVYGLSGTPAPNGLQDWFGVLSVIDPTLLPVDTKTAFESRYCVKGRISDDPENAMYNVRKIIGYRNVDELHRYIGSISSRVTKEECLDLPPKIISTRTVKLEGEQARIYRDLKRDAVARIKVWQSVMAGSATGFDVEMVALAASQICDKENPSSTRSPQSGYLISANNILTEMMRLNQVVGGFVPSDDGHMVEIDPKAKILALQEIIEGAGQQQVVIWSCFRQEVAFLEKWLEDTYGGGVSVLHGGLKGDERQMNIERFRDGGNRWFVGTAAAGGTGVNGLQVSSIGIYYSRNFNFADWAQSQDRQHRIGTKSTVNIYKILAENTIDITINKALDRKGSLQEMMMSSPESMLGGE